MRECELMRKILFFWGACFLFFLVSCKGHSQGHGAPRLLRPPESRTQAFANAGSGEFLFADAFDGGRTFVRLPEAPKARHTCKSDEFRLEGRNPAALTQPCNPETTAPNVFVLHHEEQPVCTFTAHSFFRVHRVTVHSGQFEELGLALDEDGQTPKPDFVQIANQAAAHFAVLAENCPAPANREDFVWAHPQGHAPQLWRRLPESHPEFAKLQRQVEEQAMQLPFGAQAEDYRKEIPNAGPLDVRTAVFVSPDGQEYRVEDFRRIGETLCGGTGFEQWSLWAVRGGQIRLADSAAQYRQIRLVLDLNGDGEPEFVAQTSPFNNERALFACRYGKCRPIRKDAYPFNECPC